MRICCSTPATLCAAVQDSALLDLVDSNLGIADVTATFGSFVVPTAVPLPGKFLLYHLICHLCGFFWSENNGIMA